MHYICRRGHPDRKQFCDILLEDLMPDGGLYVPEAYPRVDDGTLGRWLSCSILAPHESSVRNPDLVETIGISGASSPSILQDCGATAVDFLRFPLPLQPGI
jgi:hypothetical protein